jgi:hypothetical protein
MSAYRLLGKSIREGDAGLWFSLQSKNRLAQATDDQKAEMRKQFVARPGIQYVPLAARAVGPHAAVSGRLDGTETKSYEAADYVLEDDAWKVEEENFSENPVDPRALYALVPPSNGDVHTSEFALAAHPLRRVRLEVFQRRRYCWKMQATRDESFLYVRFEAKAPLTNTGLEVYEDKSRPGAPVNSGVPSAWPMMKIKISTGDRSQAVYELQAGDVIQTKSTFDKNGKANSNRFFVLYHLILWDQANHVVFENNSSDTFTQLINAQDRFIDLKVPLQSLGLVNGQAPQIRIEEANFGGTNSPLRSRALSAAMSWPEAPAYVGRCSR